MIDGKRVLFGYGDILVGAVNLAYVTFEYIKPNQTIGEAPKGDYEVIEVIKLPYKSDMYNFYEELLKVSKENCVLRFRHYVLDFSNYNQESVNAVRKSFFVAVGGLGLAC